MAAEGRRQYVKVTMVLPSKWPSALTREGGGGHDASIVPAPKRVTGVSPTLTALIVDDHSRALDALGRRLDAVDGLQVVANATSPPEAIEAAKRLQPNVVICDVRLNNADGVALVSSLAALPQAPAVIVHTSFLSDDERRRLATAGARAFVLKDAGLGPLIACLETIRSELADR